MRASSRATRILSDHARAKSPLFICRSCQRSLLAQSAPPATQRRHVSSQNAPFTENIRRKIWGTSTSPSMKDPYSGTSNFERKNIARQQEKEEEAEMEEIQKQLDEAEKEQKLKSVGVYGETDQLELKELRIPQEPQVYKPADTWDGLEHVGHRGDWRDIKPAPVDEYKPFTGHMPRKAATREELYSCMYQSIVEFATLGERVFAQPPRVRSSEYYNAVFGAQILPLQEGVSNEISIKYASEEAHNVIENSVQATPYVLAYPSATLLATDLESAETKVNELAQPVSAETGLEQPAPGDGFFKVPYQQFLDVSLADLNLSTFQILKRFTQLSGHRIPDPLLSNRAHLTVGNLVENVMHATVAPESKKLAERLMQSETLAAIGNLQIKERRETPIDKEKEVGRWKIIERELTRRGLPVTGGHDRY